MTNQHPIIPSPEIVDQLFMIEGSEEDRIIAAYKAGADIELEACVNYIDNNISGNKARELRAARRPKAPSLKEQALAVLDDCADGLDGAHENVLRRALEALDD